MSVFWIALAVLAAAGAEPQPRREASWKAPGVLRGGGADPLRLDRFFTWGDRVLLWEKGRSREVARAPFGYDDGGCVIDADGDGETDLILARRSGDGPLGDLVWLRGPGFEARRIDTGVEMHDCQSAALFGRNGFLMLHRNAQVRFYHRETNGGWPVEEIYSIYTASRQAGLALADVDGDGRLDIFAGNYWVRSPESAELPWRIFAIQLHHETEESATFAYAAWPDLLVGAQRERMATPIRIFTRPVDPRQLWPERTAAGLPLDRPLAAARWGDWAVVGHERGFVVLDPRKGWVRPVAGKTVRGMWVSRDRLYLVSAGGVEVWRR